MTCIIVDDEPLARQGMEMNIANLPSLQLMGSFGDALSASDFLHKHQVDLMFLDINMPKMSGIEFLRSSAELPMTILTTAYSEYALEGFELDVLDYLVKPFSAERFLKACIRAKEYYEVKNKPTDNTDTSQPDNYFFVKCNGKIEKIVYDELLYVEAMLNYVVLHMGDRKMMVYLTIKGIEDQLPRSLFLKIHKSTIINTTKVKSIEGNEIDLGKAKVTISQNLHDVVMKEILKDKMIKR